MEFTVFLLGVTLAGICFFVWWLPWEKDREYIRMEIKRSLDSDERSYWEAELKKLYLAHTPLVGGFFRARR